MTEENISDHDLLIRVDVRLEDLIKTVSDMRDGTNIKIVSLDNNIKCVETDVSDLKATRIDFRNKIEDSKLQCIANHQSTQKYVKFMIWLGSTYAAALTGLVIWALLKKIL